MHSVIQALLLSADGGERQTYAMVATGQNSMEFLAPQLRLASEMSLHEADERRALDGELDALAARWREAEEIASIADRLFIPADVEKRLEQLRTSRRGE